MEDYEILDICMENSYDLIMGRKSLDEILESNEVPYLLWNVVSEKDLQSSIFNDVLDLMIKYYEDSEEYERCDKLLKFKKNEKLRRKKKIRGVNRIGETGV
tara:strand:- start:634 stop:936 length:303 start_codon:yes stop_codon:yes gene_type:complete